MNKYTRLKLACYFSSFSMSIVGNLSPLLFLTFRNLYGISYSLLALLVTINFCTQLGIDLIFSFFSHKFNIPKTVRFMPLLTVVGLLIYALFPFLFPNHVYIGLLIGTVLFSLAAGLGEVLISPVIATIPAKDPDREMSKLHSVYAWGVVGVVILSTCFLLLFGAEHWQWLAIIFTLIPLTSVLLFSKAVIPPIDTPERTSGALHLLKNKGVLLCVFAIFLGGSAECTMAQWASGYLERALSIPKVWGDIFGVALFAFMLGTGRSLYAKYGKQLEKILLFCTVGATLCYLVAAISPIPLIGLIACALTGLCTSMLWPGTLVVASERHPSGGVFIYAMMAAGGDFGASVGPQLIGVITDTALENPFMLQVAEQLSLSPEQLGMKCGMLIGMLFPLVGIPVFLRLYRNRH